MHTLPFRKLSLVCALVFAAACGDDKGGDTESSTTGTTPGTTTNTTPGTTTNTTPATTMNPSGTTSDDPTTNEPTTDEPTTDEPTTDPTTTMTTEDPTSGGGGQFCQEECAADGDCMAMGTDIGFTCKDKRCQGTSTGGCASDSDCEATFSGWVTTCASQAECPGQACIDIGGGAGRCATVPSDFLMCETIMQTEIMLPAIEGGMDIAVCANTDYECKDEVCQNPCEDNLACANYPGSPQCNVDTGKCECTSDDDCANSGVMGYAKCNSGVCGCGTGDDCMGAANADVCTKDGYCGCSSASACTMQVFDGTTPVCEGA